VPRSKRARGLLVLRETARADVVEDAAIMAIGAMRENRSRPDSFVG